MKMRAWFGLFLLLLLIGAIVARTRMPRVRGPGETWHISQSTYAQSGSRSALLEPPRGSRGEVAAAYGKLPLRFEANQGQTDPQVKFLSRGSGYILFLTSTEAVLTLQKPPLTLSVMQRLAGRTPRTRGTKAAALRMKLVCASFGARIKGLESLPGRSNYFIGNDPARWHANVPTYAKVRYESVYPGVDLVYYGNQGQLEYDFVVAPGADPRIIRLAIAGTERLEASPRGDLVLHTAGGEVRLHKPVVYQQSGGIRKEIAGRYVVRGKRQIGFEVAAYDADTALIIDPVLSYSTYLGGSAEDFGSAIGVDASGNAYVTGSARSLDFPIKNSLQAALTGGSDVFVTKLDPTGSTLVYSTYLGGSGDDSSNGIAVDPAGNAYVTGSTASTNFPTKNALQSAFGGTIDAFVAKLDSTGSLIYSTFLGGGANESGRGIAVDGSGNAYVAGSTNSTNFPTKNPFQAALGSNSGNAFVAKLAPAGSTLVYSTYLGGNGGDSGNGIAVDGSGNAYVTGSTLSTNFPTKNPLQPALGGGEDAFVTKLDPTGSALVYSTYLGGSSTDFAFGVAVDSSGNAYVTGSTNSLNFPLASPFQGTCGGCSSISRQPNAFVAKLSAAGSALVYSTYLGGSGNGIDGDFGNAIAVDAAGSAHVTGLTSSPNFPLASPVQASLVPRTCSDFYYGSFLCGNTAFVTKFNPTGSPLVYSTYLGASGGNFEEGHGIAVDATGNAYVTGRATSNFLLTPGAFQTSPGGIGDAFLAKISPNDAAGFSLSSFSLNFSDEGIGGTTAPQQITLANTGSAALTIASIVLSGSDFAETHTCGSGLAGGTSCTISVTFTPTVAGARTGTITITDSVASSPQIITLTGNGIVGLAATLSPTSLNFGNQVQGTASASQTVTFNNTGSAKLTINGFSIGGTNPSDFRLSSTNCGQSLAVGTSCTFNIVFAPQAVGSRSATLQIFDNSAQSPRTVSLSGFGTDFSISPAAGSITSVTVTAGQSATYTVSAVGTSGFSGTVSLSCTSPAPQSTCSVSPNQLTVNGTTAVNATVTVTTTARSALPPSLRPPIVSPGLRVVLPWLLLLLSLVILIEALRRPSRRRRAWVGLAAMLIAAALFFGCGGGGGAPPPPSGTPAGTYQIAVSATSAGATRTTTLSLTVR